jgi:hypothetical protein
MPNPRVTKRVICMQVHHGRLLGLRVLHRETTGEWKFARVMVLMDAHLSHETVRPARTLLTLTYLRGRPQSGGTVMRRLGRYHRIPAPLTSSNMAMTHAQFSIIPW